MGARISHKDLKTGTEVFDHEKNRWRTVLTEPEFARQGDKLIVRFTDGGAAIELPGHRWPTR